MYQPYPSTDKPVEPDRPPAPQSVLNAVKLMYAGAALSAVSLIVSLVSIGGTKDAIKKARPSLTAAQGKNWARILSTVLFGLATLDMFGVFSQPKTVLGLVFPVLTWLIGLGAVILLWRGESTEFFKPRRLV